MFAVGNCDCMDQSGEKGEEKSDAKSKSEYDKDSANATGERAKETPPIEMRVKIKNPHGASKLRPTMIAREKNRAANENEYEPNTGAQK